MNLKKIVIAPDSFKGSLSSIQVACVIGEAVEELLPDCMVVKIPIADGGEGSIDAIISTIGGEILKTSVLSPDDRQIMASYGIAHDGTAILEMAQSSGLTKQLSLHPMTSSTYGFGQLIRQSLDRGVREFVLCLGGSATTDGGCGMAAALGVHFFNSHGGSFIPCGRTMKDIARIDLSTVDARIRDCRFTVLCDVENPLFGVEGAAYVYGPQKGASHRQILELDEGLRNLGGILFEQTYIDYASIPGAGAAGGLGLGCMVFLGARLESGSETILDLCGFAKQIKNTDLIITGEGKLDTQSFQGKVLSGILKKAKNRQICSICGTCTCDPAVLHDYSIRVFEISNGISKEESMRNPEKYLRIAAQKAIAHYDQI